MKSWVRHALSAVSEHGLWSTGAPNDQATPTTNLTNRTTLNEPKKCEKYLSVNTFKAFSVLILKVAPAELNLPACLKPTAQLISRWRALTVHLYGSDLTDVYLAPHSMAAPLRQAAIRLYQISAKSKNFTTNEPLPWSLLHAVCVIIPNKYRKHQRNAYLIHIRTNYIIRWQYRATRIGLAAGHDITDKYRLSSKQSPCNLFTRLTRL